MFRLLFVCLALFTAGAAWAQTSDAGSWGATVKPGWYRVKRQYDVTLGAPIGVERAMLYQTSSKSVTVEISSHVILKNDHAVTSTPETKSTPDKPTIMTRSQMLDYRLPARVILTIRRVESYEGGRTYHRQMRIIDTRGRTWNIMISKSKRASYGISFPGESEPEQAYDFKIVRVKTRR